MAPFGKVYGYSDNPRTVPLLAIAKENNLEVELVETRPDNGVSNDYRKLNKLGKIPTFEGADGFVLSEVVAIAVYFTSQNEKTTLLGKTKQDYASILKWLSLSNSELLPSFGGWFRPLLGKDPYNKASVELNKKKSLEKLKVYEDYLTINTYLVGERITLADIFTASIIGRGFDFVLDKAWRDEHPAVTRWYTTVANQPILQGFREVKFVDQAIQYTPPKKAEKPKQEAKKAEPKPKKEVEEEEEEAPAAPKPKHPLEDLGKASIPIDEWKRQFKNEETREVALPWFWKTMPFEEYSIWQIDYKYNDELTQVFMSSNLVTGFFTRLEGSRKFIMGCASVFGQNNDSVIRGAFVIRGQEYQPAFEVAPDWESYDFKKLDPKSDADRAFFDDMMAWDKPVTVEGKEYEFQDGKIFV